MDNKRRRKDSIFYANLFDLESVVDLQLQQKDDDFDYYGNGSQDESIGIQGGTMAKRGNGVMSSKDLKLAKKKKLFYNSGNLEDTSYYRSHISEERYREMLKEHTLNYKRRSKDIQTNPAVTKADILIPENNNSASKSWKLGNEHKGGLREMEATSEWHNDSSSQKPWNCSEANLISDYDTDRMMCEPAYLDIEEGITYKIPPTYDKLMPMLNMPCLSDIKVDEFYLKGTLDLGSLAAMMASDKRLRSGKRAGMGEPQVQNETLQAKLKALPASSSAKKFSLKVSCAGFNSPIPEGAAGKIRRFILSEGGFLQVYYVKVIEKGDAYEIIERSLPKKQKTEKDPSMIEREEMERIGKVWVNISRRDIPKHHKSFVAFHRKQQIDAKRFSENCQKEVRIKVSRSNKLMRGAAVRTRKLARDMLLFWKRNDKEMAEIKKKEEREAAEALRREQEIREAERQKSRLEYLIKQTEIFSHFMQNKFNSEPAEVLPTGESTDQEARLNFSDVMLNGEDDLEMAELKLKALTTAAQNAASKQKEITNAFDNECLKLRQDSETDASLQDFSVAGSSNIDLRNPSTMPATSTVQTPALFKGCLKEYQLKGLQWLVNCYEQGLNGILADEMGLGKTIQAVSFLAHLAEEKNIWGPFLVVAPASVLNNWADEIGRFCPDLKTLPYWGGLQERVILRKNINPKRLYRREAGFHILITSYQLLVSDEKYFRRVKWQYMILDEAQAIKSSNSIRWKTLLSFNCRNRLLLTGTPIQNNMAELWALLHFIMPTLFDNHEQFNAWFSKGIESHAEHGGALNEHQLNRLHKILKPFMLRRLKKDVVSEMTRKTEVTVHCKLSSRQQAFYQAIKNKISLVELFDGSRGHLNERKIMNLMNIVIQLRKVCNHPELFERNEGSTYLYFGEIPNPLLPPPFGELEEIHYPGGYNHIVYQVPKLLYQEIIRSPEIHESGSWHGICRESFHKYFNIFSPQNGYRSVLPLDSDGLLVKSGTFGFTRLIDLSASELAFMANSSFMERLLFSITRWDRQFLDEILDSIMESTADDHSSRNINKGKFRAVTRMLLMPSRTETSSLKMKCATGLDHAPFEALVVSHQERLLSNARLLNSIYTSIPRTRAPPINALCSDRNFAYKMIEELHQPWLKRLLVGFARTSDCNGPRKPGTPHHLIQEIDSELPVLQPALQLTHKIFGSSPPMQSFDPAKLLTDSGKLQTLDILLKRLRTENHRVLLFTQMTKMLNILEDYMNYRKYRYLRLDGSSTIMDRRDMVKDFQHRSNIFVFLLSTRAGGLGINLTAADTVIFYESDWNPTLDLQAMDRAHRLGQTKDVTVYRLVCKETVEEKILQRASQKNTVQQLVMTGGHVQSDLLAPEDVVSLLLDDSHLEQKLRENPPQAKDSQKKKHLTKSIRIDDDGDAFLEDLANLGSPANGLEPTPEPEKTKSGNKKRKAAATPNKQTQPKPRSSQKTTEGIPALMAYELEDPLHNTSTKLKKPKRPKKSVKGNIEPNLTNHNAPSQQHVSGDPWEAEQDT